MINKSSIFNKVVLTKKKYLVVRMKRHLGKLKNTVKIGLLRKSIAKYISELN